jgi:glycosyltransferase involved in cell wall biosynthesis
MLPDSPPRAWSDPDASAARARKPHVMVVGHSVTDDLFGAERSLLDVLAAVDRGTFDLSCVLPGGNGDYLRSVAECTKNITVPPYRWWSRERAFDEATVSRFESLFRSERVDLVHVNTMTLMDPLLAARRLELPGILHTRELLDQDRELAALFGDDAAAVLERIVTASDFIIANSDSTYRLYHKEGRSFRLYNRVDVDGFDLPNHLEPGKLKVGIISSNLPKKGIESFFDLAVMASRRRPELEFHAIGPRTGHIVRLEQRLRAETGPVNLQFPGYVANSVDAVRQVNVVVSLPLVAESFGRTIAEAMAARRPVVAYDSGAAPELVRHGKDGFLVRQPDLPKALEHLETLADHPDLVVEMGRNGRERARQLFAPDVFATQLNGIYGRVMDTWTVQAQSRP